MYLNKFNFFKRLKNKMEGISTKNDLYENRILIAQALVMRNKDNVFKSINEAEFKVFSQWGEDVIIQYLINKLPIANKIFIEFGVEDYLESNTRFLLENNNWSGLILDGSIRHIEKIKNSALYWKYDLLARNVFITKGNIDGIIDEYIENSGFNKEIGVLSIDVDGNDYHVWKAIKSIDPVIVICEYNSLFGNKYKLTVPYDDAFVRSSKHYSNLYFGASIGAICQLAKAKGYEYIGCTNAGNDAFFVKKDYAERYIKELITTPHETFFRAKSRESRDVKGNLTYVRRVEDKVKIIEGMDVIDLEINKKVKINTLLLGGLEQ